uniref:Protein maelstrom homolog isoform X2 n=1 Tax=Crassostrea virginica TaxID=6565 RepID=A0A8B8DL38_CRAVI|nr:protein maelstrom homolog isoform X2 [Crassostrea virginica]
MPKKPARNAFYFFMKDLEPVLKKEGRVFPNGMQDIVPIAHPRWKDLPEKDKALYEKKAKDYKKMMRGADGDCFRMDNQGKLLSERVDYEAETEQQRQKERMSVRGKWPPGKEVANEVFYLINFQTLCVTDDGHYLPAEIAVIEYSVRRGVSKKLHRFIEPGRIPMGYRGACKDKSEDYHKIPMENFENADSNYRGLWIQLENFVNPNGEKPEYPPMYCLGNDIKETVYCLEWIHGRACLGIPNRLRKVYELEGMVTDLYQHIGLSVSKTRVIDMLTSSSWDYEPKTRCDYHEELECKYCSLGIIQRYAYAMSDSLCSLMNIELTGRHLPVRSDNPVVALPPSSMKIKAPPQIQRNQRPPIQQKNSYSALAEKNKKDESEDESDDDTQSLTSLRRPHLPVNMAPAPKDPWAEQPKPQAPSMGRGMWTGTPIPSNPPPPKPTHSEFPSLGRGMAGVGGIPSGGFTPGAEDFPGLGRSVGVGLGRGTGVKGVGIGRGVPLSHTQQPEGQKFAGRALAPDPRLAPVPPASWVQEEPNKPSLSSLSQSLQQSSTSQTTNSSVPPGFSPMEKPVRNSVPQQPTLASPMSSMTHSQRATEVVGRGRGIMGTLDPTLKLPKGRGYAPPGMDVQKHLQLLQLRN